MTPRAYLLVLAASLTVFACGGGATPEGAKSANDADVWAGYTGKYASPGAAPSSPSKKTAKAEEPSSDAKALYGAPAEAAATDDADAAPTTSKPTGKKAAAAKKAAPKKAAAKKAPPPKRKAGKR